MAGNQSPARADGRAGPATVTIRTSGSCQSVTDSGQRACGGRVGQDDRPAEQLPGAEQLAVDLVGRVVAGGHRDRGGHEAAQHAGPECGQVQPVVLEDEQRRVTRPQARAPAARPAPVLPRRAGRDRTASCPAGPPPGTACHAPARCRGGPQRLLQRGGRVRGSDERAAVEIGERPGGGDRIRIRRWLGGPSSRRCRGGRWSAEPVAGDSHRLGDPGHGLHRWAMMPAPQWARSWS